MVMSFIFATDLHGSLNKMRSLVKKAVEKEVDLVILGGDLFKGGSSNTVGSQLRRLLDIGSIFRELPVPLITIFGNNDWYMTSKEMSRLCPELVPVEGTTYDAGEGLEICGFSYIPASPFPIKDWELYDRGAPPLRGHRKDGFCSRSGEVKRCSVREKPNVIDKLRDLGDIRGKVLVSHTPPANTYCDLGYDGVHLGSSDLREHVLEHAPEAVLCGHIHESPGRSARMVDRLGSSVIGNPGSLPDRLTYLLGIWDGELTLDGYTDANPHR